MSNFVSPFTPFSTVYFSWYRNNFLDSLSVGNETSDMLLCLKTLMAMSTKLEHRPKNTTIERGSLALIYQGLNREAIRQKWKHFLRELWARTIPSHPKTEEIIRIRYKSESQTVLHAQSVFAITLYEVIFCNAAKETNALKVKTLTLREEVTNVCLYEVIPSTHGKFRFKSGKIGLTAVLTLTFYHLTVYRYIC